MLGYIHTYIHIHVAQAYMSGLVVSDCMRADLTMYTLSSVSKHVDTVSRMTDGLCPCFGARDEASRTS